MLQNSDGGRPSATIESKRARSRIKLAEWGHRTNHTCAPVGQKLFCNTIRGRAVQIDCEVRFLAPTPRRGEVARTGKFSRGCSLIPDLGSSSPFCTCRVHCSLRSRGIALCILALEDVGGSMLKTRLPDRGIAKTQSISPPPSSRQGPHLPPRRKDRCLLERHVHSNVEFHSCSPDHSIVLRPAQAGPR
jgi:hypothetical protein